MSPSPVATPRATSQAGAPQVEKQSESLAMPTRGSTAQRIMTSSSE